MANKHRKSYSMSLSIREMQIKAQWATTSHPLQFSYRRAKTEKTTPSVSKEEKHWNVLVVAHEIVKQPSHFGRSWTAPLPPKVQHAVTGWPSNSTPRRWVPKRTEHTQMHKNLRRNVDSSVSWNSQDVATAQLHHLKTGWTRYGGPIPGNISSRKGGSPDVCYSVMNLETSLLI